MENYRQPQEIIEVKSINYPFGLIIHGRALLTKGTAFFKDKYESHTNFWN
jgi:hypothetical protein